MLVATAGHVDHGKTVLVRALTGVDTDRLPEEKARGLSIDLGFAYQPRPDGGVLGFVDVPGHERFVRNMIAGVPAVDFALLVVAADDGPMPQTREHLAILDLLGVGCGAVAITKVDRADPARVAEVAGALGALLAGTRLAGAPVFPVSGVTGEGVPALARHLEEVAAGLPAPAAGGGFRLAIDRCFTVAGAGLVVTGAVFAGRIAVGDRLRLVPGGASVRVRAIRAQGRAAEIGRAGERCALNIAGPLGRDGVRRGQWLVGTEGVEPSDRFDARVRVLAGEARPLAHWSPVHVHHGAATLTGRIAPLESRAIAPGAAALAQVVLDRPTHLVHGDRFVLRDASARRTIAGGSVIDPLAPRRGRAREGRLALLGALEQPDARAALEAALDLAADGVDLDRFVRGRNLAPPEATALLEATPIARIGAGVAVSPTRHAGLRGALLDALGAHHAEHPELAGPDSIWLIGRVSERGHRALARALLDNLVRGGEIRRVGRALALPAHRPAVSSEDAKLWARVRDHLGRDVLQPPVVHDLARTLGVELPVVEGFLARAAGRGDLVRVVPNRYLHREAVARLARAAQALAAADPAGRFDAKTYRDHTGIGRNFTIQLLEYFDTARLTRRVGDERVVIGDPGERFGDVDSA